MTVHRRAFRGLVAAALLLVACGLPRSVKAWDAGTTHRGLTAGAVSASKLHALLARHLGRPLGSFEPLRLDHGALDPDLARALKARLERLDPAGGARPSPDGVSSAMGWVLAGAVLEKTPPERGRHHFFEPGKRAGLDDAPGLSGEVYAVR